MNILLFEPEIPQNTGNIIRLCANTGCVLHLIKPLGFSLENKFLKRAGLDYHDAAHIQQHSNFEECVAFLKKQNAFFRLFALSTKAPKNFFDVAFSKNDSFIFGPETRGLPEHIRHFNAIFDNLKLPMRENQRSLNLSNSVAICAYEVWRQNHFAPF